MHVQAALQVAAYYSELVLRDVQCRMVVFSCFRGAIQQHA